MEIPAPSPAPPLRLPDWPLPPYRYVPGLHPHPFRHPAGHLYTDGSPPPEQPWSPDTPWDQDRRWLRAADLFDQRYPWEAHEAWEALWHFTPRARAESPLLQGLIQAAAYLLKHHMGHETAAARLRARAIEGLLTAERGLGPTTRGLDLPTLRASLLGFPETGRWPLLSP